MDKEKRIDPTSLPQPQTDLTATQQGEEFIDKSNRKKDEGDVPGRQPGDSADKGVAEQGSRDRTE